MQKADDDGDGDMLEKRKATATATATATASATETCVASVAVEFDVIRRPRWRSPLGMGFSRLAPVLRSRPDSENATVADLTRWLVVVVVEAG